MKEDSVNSLRFDDEFFVESAEKRYGDGDYIGALTLLNKREEMHAPLADAYAAYADVYEALELWPLAIDCWFRFLDTCNEADFAEGYEGLAVCFMRIGDEFRANAYYLRLYFEEGGTEEDLEEAEETPARPVIRVVEDDEEEPDDRETLAEGLAHLKSGDLAGVQRILGEIGEEDANYASAAGLSAMCTLMLGDEEGAERAINGLIGRYPDDVQVLTTYCAVLGAREKTEEAKKVAAHLAELPVTSTDDLYRVSTALCATGLHDAALEKLDLLAERLPYDENVLWFRAAAATHVGESECAIESLETLVTVYPRKAVAKYYLEELRRARDGGERVELPYYYRLPEKEYSRIASFFLQVNKDDEFGEEIAETDEFAEAFHRAFDEMEGRDEKLQLLAMKVAVKNRADGLVREVLLDHTGDELVALTAVADLIARNEENSFGLVLSDDYREVFTHELDIGERKKRAFLEAFSVAYTRYVVAREGGQDDKLCSAAEDLYETLAEANAWEYFDERDALAAAIYREARLGGEMSLDKICGAFHANRRVTERILEFMM